MNKTVKILGYDCTLQFGKYKNGTIAISVMHEGEPFGTLTVNWEANWNGFSPYKKAMKFPIVVIKGYSENEGVPEDLEAAGVIQKGGAYMERTGGTVHVKLLTEEWQAIALEQLKNTYATKSK